MEDKTELLVVQATSFCNIDCSYCYLPNRSKSNHFDLEVLSRTIENLQESGLLNEQLAILWHCGEPLVQSVDFYLNASEIINYYGKRYNTKISQSFQTNGTLITQEFCDFAKGNNVFIGVSIDGPEFIHDQFRKKRNGTGTFNEVFHGISLLKKNNIEFGAIAVVTDFTLDHVNEFYNFFKELSPIRLGINLDEQSGVNGSSSYSDSIEKKDRFKAFFKNLWNMAYLQTDKLHIREFEDIIYRLNLSSEMHFVNTLTTPFQHITIDHLGNFSTFCPELMATPNQNFVFGNVYNKLISDIRTSERFNQVNEAIKNGVQKCKDSCGYFELCQGGTPSNKYFENGTFDTTETVDCIYSKKYLSDVVMDMIDQDSDLTKFIV